MSIKEEVNRFSKLSGENGWNTPVLRIGGYLDGYDTSALRVRDRMELLNQQVERASILLKATWKLLDKQKEEEKKGVVLNLLLELVPYDCVENNGEMLMDDIEEWFEAFYEEKLDGQTG